MDSTDLRSTLDEICGMALRMASLPEDHRVVAYKDLDLLFLKVEAYLRDRPHGKASALLDEIKLNAIILARLDDAPEDPDEIYAGRIGSLAGELRAVLCP